jgi:hypothetical protein
MMSTGSRIAVGLALVCEAVLCTGFKPVVASMPAMPARPVVRSLSMCMGSADLRPKPVLSSVAPALLSSPVTDGQAMETRVLRLERRVSQLNAMVEDLCSAIVYCDDVALMERNARCMGEIYLDASFTSIRRPRVLRQEVVQIMNKHSVLSKPLMYTWRNERSSGNVQRLD